MPILPENKKRYPKNWKEIRVKILKRADNRCEFCSVENYQTYLCSNENSLRIIDKGGAASDFYKRKFPSARLVKIILTIAHLDHTPENNSDDNLRALCQRCHNRYDAKHRVETRRRRCQKK